MWFAIFLGVGLGVIMYIVVPILLIFGIYKLIKYYIDKKYDKK